MRDWYGLSNIGRRRSNQDFFAAVPELGLWLLCDGMGGHASGAEAAKRAADTVVAAVKSGALLLDAVILANRAVTELGDEVLALDENARRPGTTIVALKLDENEYEIVWVGDSRAWLWNGVELAALTYDHSEVQELLSWGDITEAEALVHPRRSHLTQALGVTSCERLRPGRVRGRWNCDEESLILTSDGVFSHWAPIETTNKVLAKTTGVKEMVETMVTESLDRGGEDNITVVAVGEGGEKRELSRWSAFKGRAKAQLAHFKPNLFKLQASVLVLAILFALLLPFSARAEFPDGDTLDRVCQETAKRLAEGCGYKRLEQVAVYFLHPKGCFYDELNRNERREADEVRSVFEEVMTDRDEFGIVNRENYSWAKVLHEEGNRGTLDGNDIIRAGQGKTARIVVTGRYWCDKDGHFHLRARIFDGVSGDMLSSAHVDESLFSSRKRQVVPVLWALLALFIILAGAGTFLFVTRKRKVRREKDDEKERVDQYRDEVAERVARRDPDCLESLDRRALEALPPELKSLAEMMLEKRQQMSIVDNKGRRYQAVVGEKLGLGRGEKWSFNFADPRVSRAPQAFLKIDNLRPFIVHNREASRPTLLDGVGFSVCALQSGAEIGLSSVTRLKVKDVLAGGALFIEVVEGSEAGLNLLMFKDRLDFSGPLSLALTGAEARLAGFALEVEDGRWLLAANSAATSGLSLQSNSGKGYVKLDLEPSGRRLLLPGDQICDNKGRILLTLSS